MCIASLLFTFTEAFQQAKLRMIATRDNLKKNYIETLKAYDSDD